MTVGAPNGDTICTQSPEFPKFEEFVLATKQDDSGWWCFALAHVPKGLTTINAVGPGRPPKLDCLGGGCVPKNITYGAK